MVEHEQTIFAPLYWGFVLSIFLGGMTVVQGHVYFPAQRDRPLIRITAAFMLLFDTASCALIAYSVYYYLIPEFGSFERFKAVTPQFSAECMISAAIALMSQLYFVHQLVAVRRSSNRGSWIIIWVITAFALVSGIGGIGCVTSMYVWDTGILAHRNKHFTIFFTIAKGFSALTDVLATVAMCMFLTGQKNGLEKTKGLVSQVIMFVIQRGILVTAIQTAVLIAFFAAPDNLTWLALHMNVTRLYANTFFAMVNGRTYLRDKHVGSIMTNLSQSRGQMGSPHRAENINLDDHQVASSRNSFHETQEWVKEKNTTHIQLPAATKTVIISHM